MIPSKLIFSIRETKLIKESPYIYIYIYIYKGQDDKMIIFPL